jgi:hypothetical protein
VAGEQSRAGVATKLARLTTSPLIEARVCGDVSDLHRDEAVTVWVSQSMFDAQPAAAGH